jgi:hypothetical protein
MSSVTDMLAHLSLCFGYQSRNRLGMNGGDDRCQIHPEPQPKSKNFIQIFYKDIRSAESEQLNHNSDFPNV